MRPERTGGEGVLDDEGPAGGDHPRGVGHVDLEAEVPRGPVRGLARAQMDGHTRSRSATRRHPDGSTIDGTQYCDKVTDEATKVCFPKKIIKNAQNSFQKQRQGTKISRIINETCRNAIQMRRIQIVADVVHEKNKIFGFHQTCVGRGGVEKCPQDDSESNASMRMHHHGIAIYTAELGPDIGDDGDSIPDRGGSGGGGEVAEGAGVLH